MFIPVIKIIILIIILILRCMLVYLGSKIFYFIIATNFNLVTTYSKIKRCFGSLFITISVLYLFFDFFFSFFFFFCFFFFFFLFFCCCCLVLFYFLCFLLLVKTTSYNSFLSEILSQTELLVIKIWFSLKFKLHACYIRFVFP